MDFSGMPRSYQDCAALLEAHEAETGYKVKTLFVGTKLRFDFALGAYSICEASSKEGLDKPFILHYEDGRVAIKLSTWAGRSMMSRTARINAALPAGYRIERHHAPDLGNVYNLLFDGVKVEQFRSSITFTPSVSKLEAA